MKETPAQWEILKKDYERANPRHCGLCGLPKKYCFHEDASYMAQVNPLVHAGKVDAAVNLKSDWYRRTLDEMPWDAVLALPIPPRQWLATILQEVKKRGRRQSFWDRIAEESDAL
jgi:hypothetical protein